MTKNSKWWKQVQKLQVNKKCCVYGVRLDIQIRFEILNAMHFKHKMIYNQRGFEVTLTSLSSQKLHKNWIL